MPNYRDALKYEMDALSGDLDGFRVDLARQVPDLVLYNLGIDALEQAQAVYVLSETAVLGRSAFSNARAAYEACLDALLLTSDAGEYDRSGALARVHELLEQDDLMTRRSTADDAVGQERDTAVRPPADIVQADARTWDKSSPGKGSLLLEALAELTRKKRRHWSGMGRKQIGEAVSKASDSTDGFAEMSDFFYGLMSIHSHPRPRTGMRPRDIDSEGRVILKPNPTDGQQAAAITHAMCRLTRAAFARRTDMAP